MSPNQSMDILQAAIGVVVRISAPILLISLVLGVAVAILQAVTQIHEQSIGFILKITALILILIAGGNWMLETLQEFTYSVFDLMLAV